MTSTEDLASVDEVKVYDDEGEDEKKSSEENLSEEKIGLVTETEEKIKDFSSENGLSEESSSSGSQSNAFPFHPLYPPLFYSYPGIHGQLGPLSPSLYMYAKERLPLPPPAHIGYPPRLPHYGLQPHAPSGIFPFCPPDISRWSGLSRFPPFPGGLPGNSFIPAHGPSFVPIPGLLPPSSHINGVGSPKMSNHVIDNNLNHLTHGNHNGNNPMRNSFFNPIPHNGLLTTDHHFFPGSIQCSNPSLNQQKPPSKKSAIKKPLNAFMLFMKEMRQSVIEECTLKESAAINQILGRKWHALDRSEQNKYYEMAKKEKELHAQKYPGWSARDNYAMNSKKKKRRLDHLDGNVSSDSDSSRSNKIRLTASKLWKASNSMLPGSDVPP